MGGNAFIAANKKNMSILGPWTSFFQAELPGVRTLVPRVF